MLTLVCPHYVSSLNPIICWSCAMILIAKNFVVLYNPYNAGSVNCFTVSSADIPHDCKRNITVKKVCATDKLANCSACWKCLFVQVLLLIKYKTLVKLQAELHIACRCQFIANLLHILMDHSPCFLKCPCSFLVGSIILCLCFCHFQWTGLFIMTMTTLLSMSTGRYMCSIWWSASFFQNLECCSLHKERTLSRKM